METKQIFTDAWKWNRSHYWGLCERQMKLTYKFVIFSKNTNESFLSINEMKFEMKMLLTTKANTQNAFLVLNDFFFFLHNIPLS